MKILDVYKSMAKELFLEAEVDDDKIIKYKKKDGEQGEMKASSAKTMEKDHPAKIAYDKMTDSDSDDKSKGQGLSGSDFDRDEDEKDDKPNTDGDNAKKTDDMQANVGKEYGVSAMDIYDNSQEPEDFDSWDEYESHLNDVAKKLKDKGRKDPFDDEEDDDYNSKITARNNPHSADAFFSNPYETVQINGKKYTPIKESKKEEKDFTKLLNENYKRFSRK